VKPGHAHAEGAGRRRGQGRNIVGDGPLVDMEIALVADGDERLHVCVGRELSGRYSFGLGVVAGDGIVVHIHPLGGRFPASHGTLVPPTMLTSASSKTAPAQGTRDIARTAIT